MRTGITISVSASDRVRLEAIVNDRNASQKHVWRSRIILLTADGLGTSAIIRGTGKSKTCVWRWQERFCREGVDGLFRDKTRPPGMPIASSRVEGGGCADAETAAARSNALDSAGDGQSLRVCNLDGAENLARSWAGAASLAGVQALQRSRVRRKTARYCRALCLASGASVVLSFDEKSKFKRLIELNRGCR